MDFSDFLKKATDEGVALSAQEIREEVEAVLGNSADVPLDLAGDLIADLKTKPVNQVPTLAPIPTAKPVKSKGGKKESAAIVSPGSVPSTPRPALDRKVEPIGSETIEIPTAQGRQVGADLDRLVDRFRAGTQAKGLQVQGELQGAINEMYSTAFNVRFPDLSGQMEELAELFEGSGV